MKYPKLFQGDVITIDDVAYMVITGINPTIDKRRVNSKTYNVELRSVKYNPEKFPEYIRKKNTELPPFVKVK